MFSAALAACGGGGLTSSVPSVTPAPITSLATSAPLSSSASTPVQFSALGNGTSSLLTLPAANAATSAKVTFEESLPSSLPAPQAHALAVPTSVGLGSLSVLAAFELQVNQTVAITQSPAFTFTFLTVPTTSTYIIYLDESHPATGWNLLLGPGVASGSTITFASKTLAPPLTLEAGDTYAFALVTSSSNATPPPSAATFSGTKTVAYTYGFAYDYPMPGPTATAPPTTLSYNVTESVTEGASPYPGTSAPPSVVDAHVDETDASNLSSMTYATDEWVGNASANGSFNALLYAEQQLETSSAQNPTFTTIYTTPQLLDQYPESAGNTWTNSPQANVAYSYASGDAGTRAINADGTYTDTESVLGAPVVITDSADGSGSITGPFYGGYVSSLTFSAPSPMPSASPNVNIAINFYAGGPSPVMLSEPVWYATPPSFYQESDAVSAATSFPTACANGVATSGNDVKRTVTALDTAIGFVETTTFDTYTASGIPVCMVTHDVLSYAYDLQGNQPFFILYGPLGVQVVTTDETLALQGGASATASAFAAKRANATVTGESMAPTIAALQSHQLSQFARMRLTREHAVLKTLRTTPINALIHGGLH
ncbi:MAG: hypothetical protein KGN02_06725 [bacterium]|nr:hypothetical protein [bacterium]